MKNKKILIIIIILIVTSTLAILLSIFMPKKDSTIINESSIGKDLTNIKKTIKNTEYYLFEDNNKKYIYYKIGVSCYSPDNIEIKSVNIKSKEYNNDNKLVLEVDIKTKVTSGTTLDGAIIDGLHTDSRDIIIEVNKDCQGLIVNGLEYTKYSGGTIYNNETQKYGYVDNNGNIVIPIEYNSIKEFNEEYLIISLSANCDKGLADKSGKILVQCKYADIIDYGNNTFKVFNYSSSFSLKRHYNEVGIIDINENLLKGFFKIKVRYLNQECYFGKYYIFEKNELYGIIDKDLNVIIEPKYTDILIEQEKKSSEEIIYIIAEKDNKIAVIDFNENIIIPYQDVNLGVLRSQYSEYLNK